MINSQHEESSEDVAVDIAPPVGVASIVGVAPPAGVVPLAGVAPPPGLPVPSANRQQVQHHVRQLLQDVSSSGDQQSSSEDEHKITTSSPIHQQQQQQQQQQKQQQQQQQQQQRQHLHVQQITQIQQEPKEFIPLQNGENISHYILVIIMRCDCLCT